MVMKSYKKYLKMIINKVFYSSLDLLKTSRLNQRGNPDVINADYNLSAPIEKILRVDCGFSRSNLLAR